MIRSIFLHTEPSADDSKSEQTSLLYQDLCLFCCSFAFILWGVCVCVYLSVCVGVHIVVQMSEEDIRNPGAGITGASEQSNMGTGG